MATTPKSGVKTTEFWLTLLTVVLTAAAPFFHDLPAVAEAMSIALAVLAALGYTAARTSQKNRTAELDYEKELNGGN